MNDDGGSTLYRFALLLLASVLALSGLAGCEDRWDIDDDIAACSDHDHGGVQSVSGATDWDGSYVVCKDGTVFGPTY